MDCLTCDKRETCTELCPENKKIADQSQVSLYEEPVGYFYSNGEELRRFSIKKGKDRAFLTPTEKKILHALGCGLTRCEVCIKLNYSNALLRKHLSNIRKKNRELQQYRQKGSL